MLAAAAEAAAVLAAVIAAAIAAVAAAVFVVAIAAELAVVTAAAAAAVIAAVVAAVTAVVAASAHRHNQAVAVQRLPMRQHLELALERDSWRHQFPPACLASSHFGVTYHCRTWPCCWGRR